MVIIGNEEISIPLDYLQGPPQQPPPHEFNEAALFADMQHIQRKAEDFSRWQLDSDEMIERVGYILMGYKKIREPKTGREKWVKFREEPTLSKEGAQEVMTHMSPINKNVHLSNFPEDRINMNTKKILQALVILLGTDTALYGLRDPNGVDNVTKLRTVKTVVEAPVYAGFARSSKWKTLDTLNKAHEIRELKSDSRKPGFSLWGRGREE